MTEVVTCMHHKITEEEHSCQEVQSKVIHVYASSSSETSFDGTCFMQSKSKLYCMSQQPLQGLT